MRRVGLTRVGAGVTALRMARRAREKNKQKARSSSNLKTVGEWAVGWLELPAAPEEHVGLVVLEVPSGAPVTVDVGRKSELLAKVRELFRAACEKPLYGDARRPARLRAQDAELGEALAALPNTRVRVDATPEVDAFQREFTADFTPESEPRARSLADLPPELEGRLYAGAAAAGDPKLWEALTDGMVLGVDVPALDRGGLGLWPVSEGARLWGLLLFESVEAARSYRDRLETRAGRAVSRLALTLDSEKEAPPAVVALVRERAPDLVTRDIYPQLERMGTGAASPPDDAEVALLVAALNGLVALMSVHGARLGAREPGVLDVETSDYGQVTFRLDPSDSTGGSTDAGSGDSDVDVEDDEEWPNAGDLEDSEDSEDSEAEHELAAFQRLAVLGRNDPCPCGSGKKYKKCHREADEQLARGARLSDG